MPDSQWYTVYCPYCGNSFGGNDWDAVNRQCEAHEARCPSNPDNQ